MCLSIHEFITQPLIITMHIECQSSFSSELELSVNGKVFLWDHLSSVNQLLEHLVETTVAKLRYVATWHRESFFVFIILWIVINLTTWADR